MKHFKRLAQRHVAEQPLASSNVIDGVTRCGGLSSAHRLVILEC